LTGSISADGMSSHGRPPAGMGKRGHLPLSGNIVKCFLHCKTLSRLIIYALFSQPVVGFWRLCPRPPPGLHPWAPAGGLSSPDPQFAHPRK